MNLLCFIKYYTRKFMFFYVRNMFDSTQGGAKQLVWLVFMFLISCVPQNNLKYHGKQNLPLHMIFIYFTKRLSRSTVFTFGLCFVPFRIIK